MAELVDRPGLKQAGDFKVSGFQWGRVLAAGLSAAAMSLFGGSASATCMKPLNAMYVGSGSGQAYNRPAGTLVDSQVLSISLAITSTGSGTITEVGKSFVRGPFKATYTVTAANNTFNTATCIGTVTTNTGDVYTYTSANSAATITFIDTKNDAFYINYNLVLLRA
jgi:hypothetical protein